MTYTVRNNMSNMKKKLHIINKKGTVSNSTFSENVKINDICIKICIFTHFFMRNTIRLTDILVILFNISPNIWHFFCQKCTAIPPARRTAPASLHRAAPLASLHHTAAVTLHYLPPVPPASACTTCCRTAPASLHCAAPPASIRRTTNVALPYRPSTNHSYNITVFSIIYILYIGIT